MARRGEAARFVSVQSYKNKLQPCKFVCREAEAEARREAAKRERKRSKRSGAAAFLDMD